MDPMGYLKKAAGNKYIHTKENKKKCTTLRCATTTPEGWGKSIFTMIYTIVYDKESSFKKTGPHIFQEGDIVELQVSFIIVPLRDQKSRMCTTVVDNQSPHILPCSNKRKVAQSDLRFGPGQANITKKWFFRIFPTHFGDRQNFGSFERKF